MRRFVAQLYDLLPSIVDPEPRAPSTPGTVADVALVACSKQKGGQPAAARDLYQSSLFQYSRKVAEGTARSWYILSAQHALVEPSTVLGPYDFELDSLTRAERVQWASRVLEHIPTPTVSGQRLLALAGEGYVEPLRSHLQQRGWQLVEPLVGLGLGSRISLLQTVAQDLPGLSRLMEVYRLLAELSHLPGQGRRLGELTGSDIWPARGLYIFVDDKERHRWQPDTARIVRVGTHGVSAGSRSTLWQRLRTHRGTDEMVGSHRSSVFRRHVGAALLAREGVAHNSWGVGSTAAKSTRNKEERLERSVSDYLRELRVFFLAIGDESGPESDRSYLERNLVALLSHNLKVFDPPGRSWLGNSADRAEIRSSGLWNVDYVGEREHEGWLEVLSKTVALTAAHAESASRLAPPLWREALAAPAGQFRLFE